MDRATGVGPSAVLAFMGRVQYW